jgi:hypothetical protein
MLDNREADRRFALLKTGLNTISRNREYITITKRRDCLGGQALSPPHVRWYISLY